MPPLFFATSRRHLQSDRLGPLLLSAELYIYIYIFDLQGAHLLSAEFFGTMHRVLAPAGVLFFPLPPPPLFFATSEFCGTLHCVLALANVFHFFPFFPLVFCYLSSEFFGTLHRVLALAGVSQVLSCCVL